ncbi:hypothetical protein L2X99_12380 [Microbacterium sp. KUDC0406]|uniref:RNA polymerase sigma factor n=1 Tax=Microbacterium sp. KUDC0406 TaxID=2909588 RepID=UPI001F317612|nr:sigma factor [Microbacterium sp. KUDC0406]UJP09233.1 hypothetical protein L2X99_12380 [Microbacterium sp. KUDC0406]
MTDRTLVAAFRHGDADAFQTLFHRHVPAVHALIRSRLADPDDVDEVLQEVFTLAWERLDVRRMPGRSALPWMLSIAQERVASANLARTAAQPASVPAGTPGTDTDPVANDDLTATLEAAVARLGAVDREIIGQCLTHGLTYRQAVRRARPNCGMLRDWLTRLRGGTAALRGTAMAEVEEYYAAQFEEIRKRISVKDAVRRRQARITTLAGSTLAAVLLTGGALAVVQATDTEKSGSVCYQAADTSSAFSDVADAPTDGIIGPLPGMTERVTAAEAQCGAAWRAGVFSLTGPKDGGDYRVPELFTCVLADGRLGVFPADGETDCLTLRLAQP